MAASKKSVINDVKRYIEVLKANGIPVQRTLLFGSWTSGNVRDESDIDVALISNIFSGDRFADRRKIVPLRRGINFNIEPMPFTPQDFADGGILVEEIRRHGEEIG